MKKLHTEIVALLSAWAHRTDSPSAMNALNKSIDQFNTALEAVIDERIRAREIAHGIGEPTP